MTKNAKKRLHLAKEDHVREVEHKERGAPTCLADFERLVLASPNSSFAWIRYMSFLISLGDLEKAAAVAKRALASISYR